MGGSTTGTPATATYTYEPLGLGLRLITAPTKEPITATEFKSHSRISVSTDDDLIEDYITAARRFVERATGRTIHQTTYEYILDDWPDGAIVLPRATPLISISSIKYTDSDGTETTWTSSEYIADTYSLPGRVVLAYGESYPSFIPYPVAPIKIRYLAGIATTSPVTECTDDIKNLMYLLTAHSYENREPVNIGNIVNELPFAIKTYLNHLLVEYVF